MPKEVTNEELASMIKRGFDEVAKKTDVDSRFEAVASKEDIKQLDDRLDNLDARMGRMEVDLIEIRGNIVYKHEFEDLSARVKYIETKLGIESGK